ncbi:hypothetical protein PVAP13_2NG298000 [Panicum virgatum]|uniref:Uncharacterized protein n=1 Tax=Panicum virgatum TaxID=38727 RepID=A0A8T0VFL1_PANVG|nr:hypothetical protein PVAP13_2NG298000 [Panicum virgatum]KAG2634000.1 hypothetical protein PVAP13_2NG298000 [Panicum virgatum]
MDRDRSSRRARDDDGHHRFRDRDDDRHRRRSRHDTDDHNKHDGGDDDRRRRHREKDGGGDDEDRHSHSHHRNKDDRRSHRDGGDDGDDRRRHGRRSVSSSESPPPSAKRERSSSRPRESIERRDSADREPPSSSRKRKGHEGGGGGGGDETDRDVGKRARASVDPPPPKEERPRRERRRFEDVDANGKNGDVRSKGSKEISSRDQKMGELAVNGDLQSGAAHSDGSQQPLNAAPAVVSSSVSVSSKVSSITINNENEGVSIRSDEVTGKSSTDGSATSAAGKNSNLSLDALAKAKKALQLKKELSEKLKKLPMLNKLGTTSTDMQVSKKEDAKTAVETQTVSKGEAKHTGPVSGLPMSSVSGTPAAADAIGIPGLTSIPNLEAVKRAQELAAKMGFRQDPHFAPLINMFPGTSTELTVPQRPPKAPVLRLDAQGREIDEQGKVISMTKPTNLSTLKVKFVTISFI